MHVRKQILDAAQNALTGLPTTGTAVFTDRAYPIPQEKLPALRIFFSRETAEPSSMGPVPRYQRRGSLMVVGYAGGDGLDETLDQIASEVEPAIFNQGDFGGVLVGSPEYIGADFALDEGDSRTGYIAMSWEMLYRTPANDPETSV